MAEEDLCPCGSGKKYSECCEPIIKGTILAPTPEALMRSRYTAYAKHEVRWLKDSLEPSQQTDYDEKSVEEWSKRSQWLGIQILQTKSAQKNGQNSYDGKNFIFHEISSLCTTVLT